MSTETDYRSLEEQKKHLFKEEKYKTATSIDQVKPRISISNAIAVHHSLNTDDLFLYVVTSWKPNGVSCDYSNVTIRRYA